MSTATVGVRSLLPLLLLFRASDFAAVATNEDSFYSVPDDVLRRGEREWKYAAKLAEVWRGESSHLWQCASEELKLDCTETHHLVIFDAELTEAAYGSREVTTECAKKLNASLFPSPSLAQVSAASSPLSGHTFATTGFAPPVNVRRQIVSKCSGEPRCAWQYSYSDVEETPFLHVEFYCAPVQSVATECDGNFVVAPHGQVDGFIKTPGYPNFYAKVTDCSWNITTQSPYSLMVAPLDINIKEANMKTGLCEDSIRIQSESGDLNYGLCGKSNSVRLLVTNSTRISIHFNTRGWDTATGAFLYYRVVGCENITDMEDAVVVRQSSKFAAMSCRKGHLVPDQLTPWLATSCLANNRWNVSLPEGCRSLRGLAKSASNYTARALIASYADDSTSDSANDVVHGIVVPCLVMVAMFVAAAIIWYHLLKAVDEDNLFDGLSEQPRKPGGVERESSVDGPLNNTASASLSPCSLQPNSVCP